VREAHAHGAGELCEAGLNLIRNLEQEGVTE